MSKPGISINLPPRVESGEAVKAADFNSIRQAVARLARSGTPELPRIMPTTYKHPWKLQVVEEESEIRLKTYYGAVTAMRLNNLQPTMISLESRFNAATPTYLINDPYNPSGTIGHSVLSISTTYGVWVQIERFPTESFEGFGGDDYDGMSSEPLLGAVSIFVTDDFPDPDDQPDWNDDLAFVHVGTVAVDGDGAATIKQRLRSDIFLPIVAYPYGINFPDPPEDPA
jgi:hypothetical protein